MAVHSIVIICDLNSFTCAFNYMHLMNHNFPCEQKIQKLTMKKLHHVRSYTHNLPTRLSYVASEYMC